MPSPIGSTNLREHFGDVPDPRVNRTRRHNLIDVLVIALCAILSGADDFVYIEMFGKAKKSWFKERLELPNGIPSHDTFARVFAKIDPLALEKAFLSWIEALKTQASAQEAGSPCETQQDQEVVSIDGKTVRKSFDTANGKSAIHMVSAWATNARLVLGQVKVDDKSNEITAIPELLDLLDISGCLVTIDAMGCQKAIAAKIREKGGDYVLALKDNQPNLNEDVRLFIEHAIADKFTELKKRTVTNVEKDHGRIETRTYTLIELPDGIAWADEKQDWPGLKSVGMVTSQRQIGTEVSVETRYFIASIPVAAKQSASRFARAIRSHWGIENSVHWVLDVIFNEDACRVRKENAPENLAVMRHIALNLFRQDTTVQRSIKGKRHLAMWDIDYMANLIGI